MLIGLRAHSLKDPRVGQPVKETGRHLTGPEACAWCLGTDVESVLPERHASSLPKPPSH